jgi:hypothetical protein
MNRTVEADARGSSRARRQCTGSLGVERIAPAGSVAGAGLMGQLSTSFADDGRSGSSRSREAATYGEADQLCPLECAAIEVQSRSASLPGGFPLSFG